MTRARRRSAQVPLQTTHVHRRRVPSVSERIRTEPNRAEHLHLKKAEKTESPVRTIFSYALEIVFRRPQEKVFAENLNFQDLRRPRTPGADSAELRSAVGAGAGRSCGDIC